MLTRCDLLGAVWSHLVPFSVVRSDFDSLGLVWSGLDQKNLKFYQKKTGIFFGAYEPYMDFIDNGHQVSGLG